MKAWRNLGVVETIYEEDSEYSSSCSPSLDRTDLSTPYTPLHCRVEEWSLATKREPDVFISVRGTNFHLHKDALSKWSGYLKRHLTDVSELTLSPPLNITADTFSLVAAFCYGAHIVLTPSNVASLRVAAELLQMAETAGDVNGRDNLKQMTESYFRQATAVNGEFAAVVLRSCLFLLPEAETTASLVGRCIEALGQMEDGDGVDGFVDAVIELSPGDFTIVAEAMHSRFSCHDLLYKMTDIYMQEREGEIAEDQKVQICNFIDCGKLTFPSLLHAVQNPKMPLRFIVRAMLAEQLNTRRSIVSAARRRRNVAASSSSVTLGSILQHDSAACLAAQLRTAMDATSSRIQSLEKELEGMKKILEHESEKKQRSGRVGSRSVLDSGRSASFHCVVPESNGEIERGERGSVSSLSMRFRRTAVQSTSSGESSGENLKGIRKNGNIFQKLIKRLKNPFWVSKQGTKTKDVTGNEREIEGHQDFDQYLMMTMIKDDDGDDDLHL